MRHKRQALQDMARPLKQWLYKHRDNPYPTKTEKILLALGSQMTLVQVRDPSTPTSGGCSGEFHGREGRVRRISRTRPRELSIREASVQAERPRVLCSSFPPPPLGPLLQQDSIPQTGIPTGLYSPNRNSHLCAILAREVRKAIGKRCVLSLRGREALCL